MCSLEYEGTLHGASQPEISVELNTTSMHEYLPLANISGTLEVEALDESVENWNIPAFNYGGETYDQIGIVSNGYIVVE
jgi:hypothetical protein